MKIQDVSEITGLTQKTIRFYERKELISPSIEYKNERAFRDYTEHDIAELNMIANLRKALFSIEQIKTMATIPESVPVIMKHYQAMINENYEKLTTLKNQIDCIDADSLKNVYQLSQELSPVAQSMPLPKTDVIPHFRYLDEKSRGVVRMELKSRVLSRAFIIFLIIVFAIAGLNIWHSYKSSTYYIICGEEYKLAHDPTEPEGETRIYEFESGGGWKSGGTSLSVRQAEGRLGGRTDVKGTEFFCSYTIVVKENSGEERTYKYQANGGNEWASYGRDWDYRFPAYQIVMPDGTIIDRNYKNTESWYLLNQISEEEQFVLESIIAVKDYVPFSKSLTVTLVVAAAAVVLWLGARVIVSNLNIITDPHRRFFGYDGGSGKKDYIDKLSRDIEK